MRAMYPEPPRNSGCRELHSIAGFRSMDYRIFRLNCVMRVAFLAGTTALLIYLAAETSLYATIVIVGLAFVLQVASLIHYVERTNRDLTRFLASIRYSDFSQSFSSGLKGRTFDELNEAFSEVISDFREARAEKEEQYRYLQTVVQHIGLGIISFDGAGNVDLINNAAKRLLGVPGLRNVNSLETVSSRLVETLTGLKPGERALVKVDRSDQTMQLIIFATEFKLRDRVLKLVSMQNIESELSEKEMEAWQKLIRVLTHEIMNSVTPIASLASTVNDLLGDSAESDLGMGSEQKDDIRSAMNTIEKRSNGLLSFVNAYRNLTRIPAPNFEIVVISDLLDRVAQLMREQIEEEGIELTISVDPESLELTADPQLIEQVLINLILNSIQALRDRKKPRITIESMLDERGQISIVVRDNGPGISSDLKDKIFTPFFTTKKDGSGIGLSLSRQIMRLHRGSISIHSEPDEETRVALKF